MEGFAFLNAGAAGVAEADDAGTELVGSTFETQTGSGGGFEEKSGYHFVAKNALLGILFKVFGNVQHLDIFFFGEVGDGDEVSSF